MRIKIISVVGARPNFMKVAPIHKAFQKYKEEIDHLICHTGQHYDEKMSDIFFRQLNLPLPDFYLGIGSGTHAEQTGKVMIKFEKILLHEKPDLVIVVDDVNSTIACSLTAKKLNIKVAHVEAGLRSFDREMPEEINRILTDSISDYLFVTEESGIKNLKNEGVEEEKGFFVGNCMIDSLVEFLNTNKNGHDIFYKLNIEPGNFILITMHRPSNVDSVEKLNGLMKMINLLSEKRKIIFPVHPRTKKNLENYNLLGGMNHEIVLTEPLGYTDFITLVKNAELILTDSGGIQEESTFLNTQCITIRDTTERPSTVEIGTNQLVGDNFYNAEKAANNVLAGRLKNGAIPELWDGKAAERIAEILINKFR
jgi:UDP-N-acetylglucosamine 2-epimerase (non-hydrolysing)